MATDRSTELKLLADNSLSVFFSFLPLRNGPPLRFIRFCDKCSPHKFEPPCVYGILSNAMPCRCGPLANSNETPSHCFVMSHDEEDVRRETTRRWTSEGGNKKKQGNRENKYINKCVGTCMA